MSEEGGQAAAPATYKSTFSTFRGEEGGERRSRRVELAEGGRRLPGLPRYGGSSFSAADRPTAAAGPTYRLASLDRLAHRHKLYASESADLNGVGDVSDVMEPSPAGLQNRREMFFRGETPPSGAPPPVPKEAASKAPAPAAPSAAGRQTRDRDNKENRPEVSPKPEPAKEPPAPEPKPKPEVETARRADEENRERQQRGPQRRARQLDGYVGFANLPNQVYRRAVKKGFHFTLMVVGESGLGKSTLVNSMFMSDIYNNEYPGPSHRIQKTVAVDKTVVHVKENGVNLSLTVVDTPGFGDAVDNSNCWQPVIEFIESRYEEYLNAESRVRRSEVVDSRVHCCIYCIGPSGHGLKPLDVEFMKRLHDKVNIVPVIAKADTMTPEEITRFKRQILNEIAQHKIRIYEFPECDDEEEARAQKALRERVPFAVVGANTIVEVDGKKVRGRRYPWGVVQIESMDHSDFIPLRNMLIRTHMMDLRDVTSSVHYENYRCRKLAGVGTDGRPSKIVNKIMNTFMTIWNPLAQMEEEKRDHELKMKKMESEMEQVFEMKVKEKRSKLKESEDDLQRRQQQMLAPLEEQRRQLEERRAAFLREREDWERLNGVTVAELRRRELESHSKETMDGKKKRKGLF
ncbi:septin-7-like isoform X2 [Pollicipes pollicipes]|uniref:septin-7-like isoform X2 n=1 Tax=Pollicipes pollicipes TaxID=41117 RepID=UPI0018859758|nr:septin-7-like isoform X2 [Pollicipes pollicipes]